MSRERIAFHHEVQKPIYMNRKENTKFVAFTVDKIIILWYNISAMKIYSRETLKRKEL